MRTPVRQQQVQGRFAQLAVKLKGAVVADCLVDEWDSGRQQQHEKHQVHAGEAGHNPQRGEGTGWSREAGHSAVGQPQGDRAGQRRPEKDRQQIRS